MCRGVKGILAWLGGEDSHTYCKYVWLGAGGGCILCTRQWERGSTSIPPSSTGIAINAAPTGEKGMFGGVAVGGGLLGEEGVVFVALLVVLCVYIREGFWKYGEAEGMSRRDVRR